MHIILRRTANIYMVLKAEEDLLVLAGLSSAGIYSGKQTLRCFSGDDRLIMILPSPCTKRVLFSGAVSKMVSVNNDFSREAAVVTGGSIYADIFWIFSWCWGRISRCIFALVLFL